MRLGNKSTRKRSFKKTLPFLRKKLMLNCLETMYKLKLMRDSLITL